MPGKYKLKQRVSCRENKENNEGQIRRRGEERGEREEILDRALIEGSVTRARAL